MYQICQSFVRNIINLYYFNYVQKNFWKLFLLKKNTIKTKQYEYIYKISILISFI